MPGDAMKGQERLSLAIKFADHCHQGQKWGDLAYIVHLYSVARHFNYPETKIVAFLHDTVEDGKTTFGEIARLFGEKIAEKVKLLTRTQETYAEYIKAIAESGDEEVVKIKIADLEENLHFTRFINSERASLIPRYEKSLTILKGVLAHE